MNRTNQEDVRINEALSNQPIFKSVLLSLKVAEILQIKIL
jgi:hypothetical protein